MYTYCTSERDVFLSTYVRLSVSLLHIQTAESIEILSILRPEYRMPFIPENCKVPAGYSNNFLAKSCAKPSSFRIKLPNLACQDQDTKNSVKNFEYPQRTCVHRINLKKKAFFLRAQHLAAYWVTCHPTRDNSGTVLILDS